MSECKRKKGFTLIELLVVIAIMAILAAVVIVNLGRAKTRANEARVSSDLAALSGALTLYKDENPDGKYPNSGDGTATGFDSMVQELKNPTWDTSGEVSYIDQEPTEPSGYSYRYCSTDGSSYLLQGIRTSDSQVIYSQGSDTCSPAE